MKDGFLLNNVKDKIAEWQRNGVDISSAKPKRQFGGRSTIEVRDKPRGSKVERFDQNQAIFSIPSARKWWFPLPFIAAPLLFWGSTTLGTILGFRVGRFYEFSWAPMTVLLVISCVIVFIMWKSVFPRMNVRVDRETIDVNGMLFDRKHTEGFRIGYKVEGSGDQVESWDAKGVGFKTLRLSYGPWGEDLPYMANAYHAIEYVNWMNAIIAEVGKPAPAATDVGSGRREQAF